MTTLTSTPSGPLGPVAVGRLPRHPRAAARVAQGGDPVRVDAMSEVDAPGLARGRVAERPDETAAARGGELLPQGEVPVDQVGPRGGVLVVEDRGGVDAVGAEGDHDEAAACEFLAEVVVAAVVGDGGVPGAQGRLNSFWPAAAYASQSPARSAAERAAAVAGSAQVSCQPCSRTTSGRGVVPRSFG
ncbi:hypothetical protein ACFYYS_26030 [Streptomyces sp. NPDC002120]|uniref:hypothetical protein n=1 Tax=Streptomyces sp. NPDC002120 TaxID=3364631 RepID=UPI0036AB7BA6